MSRSRQVTQPGFGAGCSRGSACAANAADTGSVDFSGPWACAEDVGSVRTGGDLGSAFDDRPFCFLARAAKRLATVPVCAECSARFMSPRAHQCHTT